MPIVSNYHPLLTQLKRTGLRFVLSRTGRGLCLLEIFPTVLGGNLLTLQISLETLHWLVKRAKPGICKITSKNIQAGCFECRGQLASYLLSFWVTSSQI